MPAPIIPVTHGSESFHRLFMPGVWGADSTAFQWFARHYPELHARGLVQYVGNALVTSDARGLRRACLEIAKRPLPDGQNLTRAIRTMRIVAENGPQDLSARYCWGCRTYRDVGAGWRGARCPVCIERVALREKTHVLA